MNYQKPYENMKKKSSLVLVHGIVMQSPRNSIIAKPKNPLFKGLEKTSTITSKSKWHSLVMDPSFQKLVVWVLIIHVGEVEGLEEGSRRIWVFQPRASKANTANGTIGMAKGRVG